jgi:predicted DNA-binding transcriptional regulator YafY
MVVCICHMPRANGAQKAERLNLARDLLLRKQIPEAVSDLAQTCSISHRQAYRYLQRAQNLKKPVPVVDPKIAFTVKLSRTLVDRLRAYASSSGQTLSDLVNHALVMLLNRGSRRG